MYLTGEFSKIARVSKRQLQYYDEIGLLKPAHTDPQTGYRYYSARQLTRLNRILALKDLGLTLNQIARMLEDDVSDAEIQGMLILQKAELEKRLLEDLERFRRIESRLRAESDLPDVILKSVPAREILSTGHFCLNLDDGLAFVGYLTQHLPAKTGMGNLGHFIAMAEVDEFEQENIDLEFGFFVEGRVPQQIALADDVTMTVRTLPAVEMMATTVYVGAPQFSHCGYGALGRWIEANGYRIAGQQREIFIELPRPGHEDETVIEIQFPVEKIAPSGLLLTD